MNGWDDVSIGDYNIHHLPVKKVIDSNLYCAFTGTKNKSAVIIFEESISFT